MTLLTRKTAMKVGFGVLVVAPVYYFGVREPASTLAFGTFVASVVLLVGIQIVEEIRDGTDSLTLFSTVLFALGGAFSLTGRVVSLADSETVTFGALAVILLAAAIRALAWFRNERADEGVV
ncbi:hypothetical protein ACFQJC_12360 [Haloferax namakaokahaiae]|uniref:Uncharacterized protein n=1 Tax=Haloferax namakaokahaiae TaxID=1748331 RepID=A0ABD5ZGR2_9EURY